ncbi:unnamed protein product, partial [Rotaria sp. Silwood2]
MASASSQPVVFNKNITIQCVSNGVTDKRKIRFKVEFQTGNSQDEFVLKLTNDDESLFYFQLHLNEAEFKNLQDDQQLVVNFNTFHQYFIDHLNLCIRDQDNNIIPLQGSLFQLQLVTFNDNNRYLNVLEISSSKHHKLLSLPVTTATEHQIKQHLLEQTQSLRDQLRTLQQLTNIQQLPEEHENPIENEPPVVPPIQAPTTTTNNNDDQELRR